MSLSKRVCFHMGSLGEEGVAYTTQCINVLLCLFFPQAPSDVGIGRSITSKIQHPGPMLTIKGASIVPSNEKKVVFKFGRLEFKLLSPGLAGWPLACSCAVLNSLPSLLRLPLKWKWTLYILPMTKKFIEESNLPLFIFESASAVGRYSILSSCF